MCGNSSVLPASSSVSSASSTPSYPSKVWTTNEKIGVILCIITLVALALAACFAQGALNKALHMHISQSNMIAGAMTIGALLFMVPGMILLVGGCPSRRT